jgi:hypothetical protein
MSPRCEDSRVEVRVEEETIPTTNVRTEVSSDAQKSGADITRLTEIKLPLSWRGENIVDSIDSFDPANQSSYDRVTILFQSVRVESWVKVHRGFVRGVSGAESMNVGRMIVQDVAALTTAIPFSETYDRPSLGQVFKDVADTIRGNSVFNPQFSNLSGRDVSGEGGLDKMGETEAFVADSSYGVGAYNPQGKYNQIPDKKSFKSNRHSCADALNWVTDVGGGKWYSSFREGFELNLVYDDGSNSVTFTQRTGRGGPQERLLNNQGSFPNASKNELDIIENDALAEIFPVNTLTLRGATGTSILGWETSATPSKKAPWVVVQYPPFIRAAGGNVVGKTIETDNVTLDSAKNTAKKKLEQEILDSGTGEMKCYGNPYPKPYDTIRAKPECADVVIGDTPSLPYEVAGVVQRKSAFEEMKTNIKVCPVVDASLMEVKNAEMKKV